MILDLQLSRFGRALVVQSEGVQVVPAGLRSHELFFSLDGLVDDATDPQGLQLPRRVHHSIISNYYYSSKLISRSPTERTLRRLSQLPRAQLSIAVCSPRTLCSPTSGRRTNLLLPERSEVALVQGRVSLYAEPSQQSSRIGFVLFARF